MSAHTVAHTNNMSAKLSICLVRELLQIAFKLSRWQFSKLRDMSMELSVLLLRPHIWKVGRTSWSMVTLHVFGKVILPKWEAETFFETCVWVLWCFSDELLVFAHDRLCYSCSMVSRVNVACVVIILGFRFRRVCEKTQLRKNMNSWWRLTI